MNTTESELVPAVGKIILGTTIIGAIYFLSPIPLLEIVQFGLMVTLPFLAIMFACGLISVGTINMVINQNLADKVNKYVEEARTKKAEAKKAA